MTFDPDHIADLDSVNFDTGISQTGADDTRARAVDDAQPVRTAPRLTANRGLGRRTRIGRRLVGGLVLMIALFSMGGIYSLFAQSSSAD